MQLTYTIPDNKVAEYVADYAYVHKNTEMTDDEPPVPKYTDAQWVREHIMRYVRSQIVRGQHAQYRDAESASDVSDVT